MRARTRFLLSNPTTRDEPEIAKRWIRSRAVPRPQKPLNSDGRVEFHFDGERLHVDGCQPLRV